MKIPLVSLCLLILSAMPAVGCGGPAGPERHGTIVTAMEGMEDLSTWNCLLELADMSQPLSATAGPVTVFAPNDDAFDLLPAGVLEELQRPENHATLVAVIENHLVRDDLTTARFPTVGAVRTLAGQRIPIRYGAACWWYDDARVIRPNWKHTENGIVHVVNRVLWPTPDMTRELP